MEGVALVKEEEDEQLFDGEEKNSYKTFCRKFIYHCQYVGSLRIAIDNPSSPFMGENDEVMLKFQKFLSNIPREKYDIMYF